jgi:hypothetical protein
MIEVLKPVLEWASSIVAIFSLLTRSQNFIEQSLEQEINILSSVDITSCWTKP